MVSAYRNTIANSVAFSLPISCWWGIFAMICRTRFHPGRLVPLSSTIVAAMLLTAGCNSPSSTAPAEVADAAADNGEAARIEANRQCITVALNNTIYKQQSADDLATALFAQDLDACNTDFTQAYVKMRQNARDYLATMREVLAHQGRAEESLKNDGINLLCSIIAGSQCVSSFVDEWVNVDAALKNRAVETKAAMDAGKDEIERVAASYGLYARTAPPAEALPQSPPENAM